MLAAALCLAPLAAFAQSQPAAAENEQNEVVNVNKAVGEDASMLTILRSGDKREVHGYVSEVVELKHGVAFEILPHVLRAVNLEKGAARTLKYKDPEGGATRYFIQVVTTERQMPSVVQTIKSLDLPGIESSEGDTKYHYRMKYRRASEVSDIIANTVLSGEGETFADDASNTLYIKDSASDAERDIVTARFYDVPSPQVEFEVLAVEIAEDDLDKVGIDWDAWKTALGGQFSLTGSEILENSVAHREDGYWRMDSLVTVDATALASFLNYTVQSGNGKVVTRTTITASNDIPGVVSSRRRLATNRYATSTQVPVQLREPLYDKTQVTSEIPDSRAVVTVPHTRSVLTDASRGSAFPGATATDPSLDSGEKAEGIFLLVQPIIGTELVSADFRVVVNSFSGLTKLNDPIVTENLMQTRVTLKDGQTFSLGGLDKETAQSDRRGIPGLKDIPILKYLFSVESDTKRKSRIYVVATPRFRNQVLFNAPGLLSSKPDAEPALIANDALPVVDAEALATIETGKK